MTYVFQGVLAKEDLTSADLDKNFIVRAISTPGLKSGIRFASTVGDEREVLDCLRGLPLRGEVLYIRYECWGGELDHIEGFRLLDGVVIEESRFSSEDGDDPDSLFLSVFQGFGIGLGKDGYFKPFKRGYWKANSV